LTSRGTLRSLTPPQDDRRGAMPKFEEQHAEHV
jgi:hypothetical protein